MAVYTPHFAPIVVMAFLGTVFLFVTTLLIALVSALRRSRRVALGALAVATTILAGYATVLLGLSLASRDVQLPLRAWKYFCEIDCHIANAVEGVQVLRPGDLEPDANSQIVVVKLRTWFDPSTISPQRGNGPLTPSERDIRLIDETGHVLLQWAQAEAVLKANALQNTPLRTALRPGESYESYLVFETARNSRDLRLLVTSAEPLDAALWGHEISPLHGKAYFELRPVQVTGVPATL